MATLKFRTDCVGSLTSRPKAEAEPRRKLANDTRNCFYCVCPHCLDPLVRWWFALGRCVTLRFGSFYRAESCVTYNIIGKPRLAEAYAISSTLVFSFSPKAITSTSTPLFVASSSSFRLRRAEYLVRHSSSQNESFLQLLPHICSSYTQTTSPSVVAVSSN